MILLEECDDKALWDDEVLARGGHPLQLWEWGEVKSAHNWEAVRLFVKEEGEIIGAAQVLLRHLPWPFKALAYVARGPVCEEGKREIVLNELAAHMKASYGAVAVTIEPDWEDGTFSPEGWRRSDNTILIPRTLILDLRQTEDELLAAMAKKTRQYIRKSAKEGIEIRKVKTDEDVQKCLEIYKETARRANFQLHGDQYYHDIFTMMGDYSPVFAAYQNGEPVAFLWLAISAETAFELYGGMNDQGQQLRANYALKWHVIETMKKWGITRYDFNGLLNDGVSTFKQGFSSHENMLVGTYDKPLSPLYIVWAKALPLGKKIIRALKNR